MVAFFNKISSPNSTWKFEDNMLNELSMIDEFFADCSSTQQDASNNSVTSSPHPPKLGSLDLNPWGIKSQDNPGSMKRSVHNEYERDRRKKLNSLYSTLRNLLPDADQTKKLSIPNTISRVLKYIPELQRQAERLTKKKQDILLSISKKEHARSSSVASNQNFFVGPVISATCLNKREVMVQICVKNRSDMFPLSKAVRILEDEGLHLMNASTVAMYADGSFYSLHLQAKDIIMTEEESYCMHLISTLNKQARMSFISCYA